MNNSSIFLEGGNRAQTQELRLTFRSKCRYAVCRGLLTYVYDFERLKLKFYTSNHRNFSVNLSIVFLFCIRRNLNPTTIGEPLEHRLGEALQGRSEFKIDIILSYLKKNLGGGSSSHNPNFAEIKTALIYLPQCVYYFCVLTNVFMYFPIKLYASFIICLAINCILIIN